MAAKSKNPAGLSANIGFEAKLWLSEDKLRNNMGAADYKHVVLGLIFLKYISDLFDKHHTMLVAGMGDTLVVLFLITLLIHAIVACFPVRSDNPENGK